MASFLEDLRRAVTAPTVKPDPDPPSQPGTRGIIAPDDTKRFIPPPSSEAGPESESPNQPADLTTRRLDHAKSAAVMSPPSGQYPYSDLTVGPENEYSILGRVRFYGHIGSDGSLAQPIFTIANRNMTFLPATALPPSGKIVVIERLLLSGRVVTPGTWRICVAYIQVPALSGNVRVTLPNMTGTQSPNPPGSYMDPRIAGNYSVPAASVPPFFSDLDTTGYLSPIRADMRAGSAGLYTALGFYQGAGYLQELAAQWCDGSGLAATLDYTNPLILLPGQAIAAWINNGAFLDATYHGYMVDAQTF